LQREPGTFSKVTYKYNSQLEHLLRHGHYHEAYFNLIKDKDNMVFYRELIFKIECKIFAEASYMENVNRFSEHYHNEFIPSILGAATTNL